MTIYNIITGIVLKGHCVSLLSLGSLDTAEAKTFTNKTQIPGLIFAY